MGEGETRNLTNSLEILFGSGLRLWCFISAHLVIQKCYFPCKSFGVLMLSKRQPTVFEDLVSLPVRSKI